MESRVRKEINNSGAMRKPKRAANMSAFHASRKKKLLTEREREGQRERGRDMGGAIQACFSVIQPKS